MTDSGSLDGTDAVGRPDTDDYDLLTFGEVSARLSELLAAERAVLAELRSQSELDEAEIRRLEDRIELLDRSARRYQEQSQTNEVFDSRFGAGTAKPGNRIV